jgi:hypothetical protein
MPIGIIGHRLRAQAEVPNFEHVSLKGIAGPGFKCHPLAAQGFQGISAPSKPPLIPERVPSGEAIPAGRPHSPPVVFARDRVSPALAFESMGTLAGEEMMSNTILWINHIHKVELRYFIPDQCSSKRPRAFLSTRVGNG